MAVGYPEMFGIFSSVVTPTLALHTGGAMCFQGMEMGGLSCESSATAVELFIRSSTVLPRRPAVLVMDAQGDQASKAPLKALNKRNAK